MRIITLNANGIRSATRKGFFEWMHRQAADIVCIQETKAQEHQLPPQAIEAPNFHYAYLDAAKKGYSGVAIYSRRRPDSITKGLGWPDMDAEARYIQADFGDLSVVSLYVPSGTSGPERQAVKYDFLARFFPHLQRLRGDGRSYIVCGDFNIAHQDIDVFSPQSCATVTGFLPQERAWIERVFAEAGWVDAFRVVNKEPRQFTWWSGWPQAWARNLGWRIDYQVLTPDLARSVRGASIYKEQRFSDHAPVTIDYDLNWQT